MIEYRIARGFILNVSDYGEVSALVTCYTLQYGKIVFRAQGLKKPTSKLSYHMIPGNIVYLTLYKKRGWHLTGAKTILESGLILHSLPHYRMMCALREIATTLIPAEVVDTELYSIFERCIYYVSKSSIPSRVRKASLYRFIILLYQTLGVFPDHQVCQIKGDRIANSRDLFWKKDVGFVCGTCAQQFNTSEFASLQPFGSFFTESPTNISSLDSRKRAEVLEVIIKDVYERSAERELVSFSKNQYTTAT